MKDKCFEIGAIQAFLDGETTTDKSLSLADHIAVCDRCSQLMAAAEEENSFVFSSLEREIDTLVPTQRLWMRINDSIAEEKSRTPFWQKIHSYVRISFANPSLTAAAGVVLVVGLFAVITLKDEPTELVRNPDVSVPQSPVGPTVQSETQVPEVAGTVDRTPGAVANPVAPTVEISNYTPKEIKAIAANARVGRQITPQTADYSIPEDAFLPGEENYVKTISDLKQNVDEQKDSVMNPSTRVSYERDMAVVNDSIKRMREVVRKNPRNQSARQVLYSSYQDKIDLLNSVAQREELLAGLR